MLEMVCQILSIPLLASALVGVWIVITAARRDFESPGLPKGLQRRFNDLSLKAEELGRRRWSGDTPRRALFSHMTLARALNCVSTVIVCLGWVWPQVKGPMSFLGALMATAAIYFLFAAMGSLIAYLALLALGWARIGGEGGGGSKVSLYSPDPGPGGEAAPLTWRVETPDLSARR